MSVINNVMSGYHTLVPYNFIDAVTGRKKIWDQEKVIKEGNDGASFFCWFG